MSEPGDADMPIDLDRVRAAWPADVPFVWTPDDVIRYHLAIGAGAPECSGPELRYVFEDVLCTLGTFAAVPASAASALVVAGLGLDVATLIHGEQEVEVYGPLPVAARSRNAARVAAVYDTVHAARIDVVVDTTSDDGHPLARSTFRLLVPGAGGFGGVSAPGQTEPAPGGRPDHVVAVATLPQQAALYRMSGDRAAVHIDPEAAHAAGLPRPTLPGLCTWGMVAKSVVDCRLGGDIGSLTGFAARFSGPVYPGETLEVSIWQRPGGVAFSARVAERDAPALSRGRATFTP